MNASLKTKTKMDKNTLLIIEVPHANCALINHYDCDEFKKFTFWSEHLILHSETSLMKLLSYVGFTKINIEYEQRYNIFNHLQWLNTGKPGGHKHTPSFSEDLVISYDTYLAKNKMTDTIVAYCYL